MNRRPKKRLKILIANGVNLDLLGVREPHIYGSDTLDDMKKLLRLYIAKWKRKATNPAIDLIFFQTNSEEKFLMEIDKGYAGAIVNAGAWTHTSLAIADRLKGVCLPYVEVHVSDLEKRETFRQRSFLKDNAVAVVAGMGIKGYEVGLNKLLRHLFAG